jgi:two-component system cell cycle response regulator DivK
MKKRVLIVEDVEFNRDLLVQLLEEDYEIITANDGGASLELAARERPDLILMDLSLPVMDGLEATKRIKADETLKSIPIIAVSPSSRSRPTPCRATGRKPWPPAATTT